MSDVFDKRALELGAEIASGALDPVDLAEAYLARIEEQDPEHRVYVRLVPERTRVEALAASERAKAGTRRSVLDGVPVAWKDNVETAGGVTAAGSALLKDNVPSRDAPVLARATRQGLVFLGKTNLTEFAFSGLGINPVTGTPANPFDSETARTPGGSSSGTAVAIARKLAPIGIGTDTGGSVRIPAAWNGLVGLKTTAGLIPTDHVIPLSISLDTVGPLARTVADAAAMFSVLTGHPPPDLTGVTLERTVFYAPETVVVEGAEPSVRAVFENTLDTLAAHGARIERGPLPEIAQTFEAGRTYGPSLVSEARATWEDTLERDPKSVFAFVYNRFHDADRRSAFDVQRFDQTIAALSERVRTFMTRYDALLMPTVAMRPPAIAPLEQDEDAYRAANIGALTNTTWINFLGLCALTVPAGFTQADADAPALPCGVMLAGQPFAEGRLLRLGAAIEQALAASRQP